MGKFFRGKGGEKPCYNRSQPIDKNANRGDILNETSPKDLRRSLPMSGPAPPEVILGKIKLKGEVAIKAAGWSIRAYLFAKAALMLGIPTVGFILLRWWLS